MMRRTRKILAAALALMLAFAMTACGGAERPTAEEVIQKVQENAENASSYTAKMVVDMEMSVMGMTMAMDMDMTVESQKDGGNEIGHVTGAMNMNALGQNQSEEMESYTVYDGTKAKLYTSVGDGWTYSETDVNSDAIANTAAAIYGSGSNWKLEDGTVEWDGKTCYAVSGVISGDAVSDIMGSGGTGMDDALGVDMSQAEFPIVLYAETENCSMAGASMDMSSTMKSLMENIEGMEGITVEVSKFVIELHDTNYGVDLNIEIPAEALAAEQ